MEEKRQEEKCKNERKKEPLLHFNIWSPIEMFYSDSWIIHLKPASTPHICPGYLDRLCKLNRWMDVIELTIGFIVHEMRIWFLQLSSGFFTLCAILSIWWYSNIVKHIDYTSTPTELMIDFHAAFEGNISSTLSRMKVTLVIPLGILKSYLICWNCSGNRINCFNRTCGRLK